MGNNHSTTTAPGAVVTVTITSTTNVPQMVTPLLSSTILSAPALSSVIPSPQNQPIPLAATPQISSIISTLISTEIISAISTATLREVSTIQQISTIRQLSTIQQISATTIIITTSIQGPPIASTSGYLEGLEGGRLGSGSSTANSLTPTSPAAQAISVGPESPASNANLAPAGITIIQAPQPKNGPFTPQDAVLGGIPSHNIDVPITVVFLILFMMGAATHFTIHEVNGKKGHKFHLSDAVFDFCMVRTVTCTMRIVWAYRPNNNSVVLAAQIFENAGVVVLFAVNVVLTQRILRAVHPHLMWSPPASKIVLGFLISVPLIIFWNIINLTVSFFTLNPDKIKIVKNLLVVGSFYTLFLSAFPVIFISLLGTMPASTKLERFGLGSFRAKLIILLFSSTILTVGAIVRLISNLQIFPKDKPGPIDSTFVFYITGFFLEIIVVILYAVCRFDLRFWVPDGCTGPGQYTPLPNPSSEEEKEALFENIDVKMRISAGAGRWQDEAVNREHATREQIRQAIYDLRLREEIVGTPIDVGNEEEVLLYAFRARKPSLDNSPPRRPPRSSFGSGKGDLLPMEPKGMI